MTQSGAIRLKDMAVDRCKQFDVVDDAKITESALKLLTVSKACAVGKQTFRRFTLLNHMNLLW